jgi:OmcA/MtrC family decaheme c-type cytochrome
VVIDDGVAGLEEYLRVQFVDGSRLWFSSPYTGGYQTGLRQAHGAGAALQKVTLSSKAAGTDYTLNAASGQITELTEFGADNAVIVIYTTDFIVPATHGLALNDSPELDETAGKWTGKSLVSGTYTVGIWGSRNLSVVQNGETTTYRGTSPAANHDFLVGAATTIEPGTVISSAANCNACHNDIYFHGGGRRGFPTCILCHGTAGAEDRPRYVAGNAPPTTEVRVEYREMLHKIHRGKDLANALTYTVNGFGSSAYPNNFTSYNYHEVGFPAMPEGVKDCRKCHGAQSTSWQLPDPRNHPSEQARPTLAWRVACGSCHDDTAAQAHIKAQTSPSGAESCSICHGLGEQYNIDLVHKIR